MKSKADELRVADRIDFAGFVNDRSRVLDSLRQADVLLFCHKTPESPRVLIESLISATPIVGYDGAFQRDLIEPHQGGRLVPVNDVDGLARELLQLHQERTALSALIEAAWLDGEPFNDVAVFAHRSELIKRYT